MAKRLRSNAFFMKATEFDFSRRTPLWSQSTRTMWLFSERSLGSFGRFTKVNKKKGEQSVLVFFFVFFMCNKSTILNGGTHHIVSAIQIDCGFNPLVTPGADYCFCDKMLSWTQVCIGTLPSLHFARCPQPDSDFFATSIALNIKPQ